eukprot:g81572.t1
MLLAVARSLVLAIRCMLLDVYSTFALTHSPPIFAHPYVYGILSYTALLDAYLLPSSAYLVLLPVSSEKVDFKPTRQCLVNAL